MDKDSRFKTLQLWPATRVLELASRAPARGHLARRTSRRTRERMTHAAAMMVAAAGLLGGAPAHAAVPTFEPAAPLFFVEANSSPTFADIDGDGDLDVFIGAKDGKTRFFENTGSATAAAFAPPLANPFGLPWIWYGTPTFADIDGDGDLDAFNGTSKGDTFFFENIGSAAAPAFAAGSTNPFGFASVGNWSNPEFVDIDGDGDLDAFIGEEDGNTFYFENTGSRSEPTFTAPSINPFGLTVVWTYPSPAFADVDGDGDFDAFLGSAGGKTFFFENTGTSEVPVFAAPAPDSFGLVNVGEFSNPAFADIDGDGDLDVLSGEDRGNTIFFENSGTPSAATFAPVSFGLSDIGKYSTPTFADIDGDGDLDAFIGEHLGNTVFFENAGSSRFPTSAAGFSRFPTFAASSQNPFGLANIGSYSIPALADIDDDGDLDVFIGATSGNTFFFENIGAGGFPAFAAPTANPFGLTDVGRYSSPAFADIDDDGDLDALIGEEFGNTFFFENTGSAGAPAFAASSRNAFGLADVGDFSTPTLGDIDGDGDSDVLLGENSGDIVVFENIGSATSPAFAAPVRNPFGLFVGGPASRPTLADIDGDGDLDAFIGEASGKTVLFENRAPLDCPPAPSACRDGFAKGMLMVKERAPGKEKLVVKFREGPALTQADFGDPLVAGGDPYRVCLYGEDDARVASLSVATGDVCGKRCWKPIGATPPDGNGFQYNDRETAADGARILKLKGGDAGKSALLVTATNVPKGRSALPTGISAALAGNASATVQLHVSRDACFSVELGDVKRADVDYFKAKK